MHPRDGFVHHEPPGGEGHSPPCHNWGRLVRLLGLETEL
jgi:hypothetical protein